MRKVYNIQTKNCKEKRKAETPDDSIKTPKRF